MLGPLLIKFGSPQQQARFLPPILAGKEVWRQGYFEPNAGSDLAWLRTEATLEGDHWGINGQKTWTTLAQDADWIFLLARTDKASKKQEGISFLLVDLASPGIIRRPIRTLTGEEEFCEMFFDGARTPKENLVGRVNDGWTMAKALLGFERIFLGSPKLSQSAMTQLERVAYATIAFEDPLFLDRYAKLHLDLVHLGELYRRFADPLKRGETLGPEVSILKLIATQTYQRMSELTMEIAAEQGVVDAAYGDARVDILKRFHLSRPATIYGGSNEIQRNILAKATLGLPDG